MPNRIADLSPEAVIDVIETNLVDASASLGRTDDGVVYRGADVTWVYTGFPGLNRVLRARFNEEDAEDRVAEVLSYFKQWDAAVSWVIGPTTVPVKLGEQLHSSGFGPSDVWSGMAMDLAKLGPRSMPAELRIEQASDAPGLAAWAKLTSAAGADNTADFDASLFSPGNAGGDPRCRYYLGYVGTEAVTRCMSFTRGNSVGIYWMHTVAPQRGKRYATAIVHSVLQAAATAGARIAVMPAAFHGITLGTDLGFKPYCQFNVYAWPPSPTRTPFC